MISDPICLRYSVSKIQRFLSCRALKPYLEALCTIPDAFSAITPHPLTFAQAVYSLIRIGNFVNPILAFCLMVLETYPAAIQNLGASAEFQKTFLSCFRVLEPLPGQLSRLLTLTHEDSSPPPRPLIKLYNKLIEQVLGATAQLAAFVDKKDTVKSAFSLVPMEFSNFLVNAINLSADLVSAAQALLDASITGEIPIKCFPATASFYINEVGPLVYSYMRHSGRVGNENEFNAAVVKIIAPGTWVRPFFLGIHGIIEKWKEGETSFKNLERCLSFSHFFLGNHIIYHPKEEFWERSSRSAAILASPAVQTEAKKYLIEYSTCIASSFPPFETGNVRGVYALILDIYAYAAMAEATVLTAQANVTFPNWKQLASNIVDLGNAWMRVNASNHTQEAAGGLSKTTAKRLSNIASGLQNLFFSAVKNENGLEEDALCMPIDVFVQLTTAVERLLAMAGSCANFYKPPAGGVKFPNVLSPAPQAVEAATVLSNICTFSINKMTPKAYKNSWKKVTEASLGALETAAKTASLLFYSLTVDEQHEILALSRADDVSCVMHNFSNMLSFQILILGYFAQVAPIDQGKLFVAAASLTFIQACAMLGRPVQGAWRMGIHFLPELTRAHGVLSDCLLTSDGRGLACLHSAAEIVDHQSLPAISVQNQKESLTVLQNLLERHIPSIDDKEPARLKLRAQVLGLRGCGNIKCTTLRPSSKKYFVEWCAGCKSVRYCGAKCQRVDWKGNHKGACKQFQAEAAA